MTGYDVVVVGLGGMGSAAAYHLARRGARVLGLEQFGIAHDQGSSHGKTRVIRQAYYEGPDYVPLLLRAYELWHALEREAGTPLLRTTGALYVGVPEVPHIVGAELSARTHRIPYEVLSAEEIRARYPVLRPRPGTVGLYEFKAGILVPEQCVATHVDLARRHGAELRTSEPVVSWTANRDGVTVRTSRGSYNGGCLVVTAGPWTTQVLHGLALPIRVERVVLYWFEPRGHRDELARLPIYGWDVADVHAYGFPYVEGQGVKVAFHQVFQEVTTPETIRREVGEDEKARMHEFLAGFIPDAAGALLGTATCMYSNTPDSHFIIDRHPAFERVVFAGGFSGHGFKFCPVVGEVLADLALRGETGLPIKLFALNRFGRYGSSPRVM
ncbi:MAG TPA: N-methyl-L-tryptophan oxidase [bacterium]|nr:N-methyl-L-tryptophan oxidase [bacterium]